MKIAYITPVLGSAGGIGRIAEEYATRFLSRGHDVTIFVPFVGNIKNDPQLSGVKIEYIRPRLQYGYGAWIPDMQNKLNGFDIVHLHCPFLGGMGAVAKWHKKNPGTKLVVTYHMDLVGTGLRKLIFRAYQKFFMPKILFSADAIFVSSMDYAENGDLKKFMPNMARKFFEIPFGIDTELFKPGSVSKEILEELGIREDESVILFVGGLNKAHYFKGINILLKAFSVLRSEAQNVHLIIVGSGDMVESYKQLTNKLKISESVHFVLGVQSREELAKYYQAADFFVLPSIDRSEAFGIVLLEAQSSGIPVIASNLAGVRSVLENEKTGLIFEVGDYFNLSKMFSYLLTHEYELGVLGRNARERVLSHYNWDLIIQKMEMVYNSLLS